MGFDIQCIPNIESVPREHFCPVCQLLINPTEALQSMCGHLYCKPCLAYVASTTMACPYDGYLVKETEAKPLVVSNRTLARTIGKTVVNCLYKNSGCKWLGSLSASTSHCSRCPFGKSLVICCWCGIITAHRQWQEHFQVCLEMHQRQMLAYIQATAAMASSQASAQGHGVAAATLTQEQWYQQPYQQYYGNGYYMHQQPLHLPSLAPQHHVYVQPAVQYVAQIHSQMQVQPQLQSQSSVLHQPHTVFPSAPHLGAASLSQAYPSVPPHPQHPSQTFSASQGLLDLQAQAHFQTTPLSQAHYLQNAQVPQHQQFHGKIKYQLEIQNPMHPQHNTVQNSPPKNTIGQCQSNQPHAYWSGENYPQPNQINQVRAPLNSMSMYHQVGTQTSQVQNHYPQKVPHVDHLLQSLPTMQKQQSSIPSQLTRAQNTQQVVLEYGGAQVPESSNIYSSKKSLPKPTLPEQYTMAPTTDVIHNQMHHGGLQNPIGLVQGLQEHPQTLQVHQTITPVLGFQPKMNHHYASASKVGSGQAAPSLTAVKEADIQRTQNQVSQASWNQDNVPLNYIFWKQGIEAILDGSEDISTSDSTNAGVNRDVGLSTIKFDHENKGKGIDACVESLHRTSIIQEGNERQSGLLGKQVMEEIVGNGRKNLGKSLLVEKRGTGSGPSLNGTPLLDPVLLEEDTLRHLNILHQHYLMTANIHSEDVERSTAYSSGSLDSGFDHRSPVRPHKKHELDFELRPTSRFSQPSIDLGERQFRGGTKILISEHLGMPSHGSGTLDHKLRGTRAETADTEGRYRFGLFRSEFEGHGNLQREKVQDAGVIGPVGNNGLWPRDVGSRSRYILQGFSGEGGSFPGDVESFPSSRKMAIGTVEGLNSHSQTRGHQQKSMDMDVVLLQHAKKLNLDSEDSSPFGNPRKNE